MLFASRRLADSLTTTADHCFADLGSWGYGQYILDSLAYVKDDLGSITAREDVHSLLLDNTRGRAALTHCKNLLDFSVLALKIFNQLPREVNRLDRKKYMAVMKSSWLVARASYFSLEEWFYDDLKDLRRGMSHNFLPCSVSNILSCTYCKYILFYYCIKIMTRSILWTNRSLTQHW